MVGSLKLWLETDSDGTGQLFVQFRANGFSGIGSAWFDLADLFEKSKLFAQYPLPKDQPVTLEGGYWKGDNAPTLEQEHLHISAYPTNSRGEIGLRVRVATPLGTDDRPQSQSCAAVEITTNYEALARFSKQLGFLAQGDIREVELNTEEA
jgi:hypothetical protein